MNPELLGLGYCKPISYKTSTCIAVMIFILGLEFDLSVLLLYIHEVRFYGPCLHARECTIETYVHKAHANLL